MRILSFNRSKRLSFHLVVSIFLVLVLSAGARPAFAQDTNSIAVLREMGKAFAEVAEKASPAVVGIRVEKTVTRQYYTIPDWPFGEGSNPFDDEFFERFFGRQSRSPHLTAASAKVHSDRTGLRLSYLARRLYPHQ